MGSPDTAGSRLSHLQPTNSTGATFVEWFVSITLLGAADMPQPLSIYQKLAINIPASSEGRLSSLPDRILFRQLNS